MATIKFSYQSDVVLGFKEIPKKDFPRQIYFIEQNNEVIKDMDAFFKIDLLEHYNNALFELGHFRKCLNHIDSLIYDVIDYNFEREGEDVFCMLLYRKSSALYNLGLYSKAEHVIMETLKINPKSDKSLKLLKKIIAKNTKNKTAGLRAVAVMFLLFGLGITCFDLLIFQSFFPQQSADILLIRNIMIVASFVFMIGIEIVVHIYSENCARKFQSAYIDKKSPF